MPSIKFNGLTKEIEMEGSESFIGSNFNMIQDLRIESFGVKKRMISGMTKTAQEHKSVVTMDKSESGAEAKRGTLPDGSQSSPVPQPAIREISVEVKANRPPMRKYIRKVGEPGHERTVIEIVEEKPKEITLASLKEKFGLSNNKTSGIFRDAEKLGNTRRSANGSYSWA